jgi:hypothetical protein
MLPYQALAQSAAQIFDSAVRGNAREASLRKMAVRMLQRCDQGNASACSSLGDFIFGNTKDQQARDTLKQRACTLGLAYECRKIATRIRQTEEAQEPRTAVEKLVKAAAAKGLQPTVAERLTVDACIAVNMKFHASNAYSRCTAATEISEKYGDAESAAIYRDRACQLGFMNACPNAKELIEAENRAQEARAREMSRRTEGPLLFCDKFQSHASDGSTEPTEKDLCLSLARIASSLNDGFDSLQSACRNGSAARDPVQAIRCLQLCGATGGSCDLSIELDGFKKVSCAAASGASGYLCDYSLQYSTNIPGISDQLPASGRVVRARFIHESYGWTKTQD